MRDLVPSSQFGRFFGRRTTATTALSVTVALLGGVLVDSWKRYAPDQTVFGYSILFMISTLIGFLGVYLLRITPDSPMAAAEKTANPFALLVAPLREANFRRLIVATVSRLHFCPDIHRAAVGPTHDTLPPDRHPHPDGHRHRGRRIGVGQHRHEALAGRPGDGLSCGQQCHLGELRRGSPHPWRSVCRLLCASHQLTLAFTWMGAEKGVTVQVLNFQSWTFYFGITCLLGLYSLHRLSFVEEPSGTTDRLLLRELLLEARRWSVHSLSSAAGLLRIVRLPE